MRLFKQAWGSLAKQPLLSWISIGGTALAIFLIMIIFMTQYVKVEPIAPESNRGRWLVQNGASIGNKEWNSTPDWCSNGGMSYATVKRTIYEMTTPEAVATFGFADSSHLSSKGKQPVGAKRLDTDHGFWKVMDFTFIDGKPYGEAEVEAGQQVAVLSESLARKLFDTAECTGREFEIDHVPYRVSGVVRDVTNMAPYAYAELWVPLTSNNTAGDVWCEHMGSLRAIILAKDKADFPEIRKEYNKIWAKMNDEVGARGWVFYLRERPYTQLEAITTQWINQSPDLGAFYRECIVIYAILLLVPAINLSSMTQSRLRRRREEIGVRRAFGATRTDIMGEIFLESLIITVVAGILGYLVSIAFTLLGGGFVIAGGMDITGLKLSMFFNWQIFLVALLFCFLLNLASAIIPAWMASRTNIVNALSGHKK